MTFLDTLTSNNQNSYNIDYFVTLDPIKNYFIHGKAGIGKTFLALQIIKEQLKRNPVKAEYINNRPNSNPDCLAPEYESQFFEFVKAQDIIRIARDQFSDNLDEKHQAKKLIKNWKERIVLIIDDLGAENTTEFAKSTVFDILDYRFDNRGYNQTIITSNVNISKLAEIYSDRTTSRILGMCEIVEPNNQTDLRIKNK